MSIKMRMWLLLLTIGILIGMFGYYTVFTKGLYVTGLNNMVVWGLWITADLSYAVISAGAFTLATVVYLLNIKRFERAADIATAIGFAGYTSEVLTLLPDIGRPERFWHPIVYWNLRSPLWMIVVCIVLYLVVLVCEITPMIVKPTRLSAILGGIADVFEESKPILAALGLVLSSLHQIFLGNMFGVLKSKPLLYRPDLGVLFLMSAIAGGLATVVLASMITNRFMKVEVVKEQTLRDLGKYCGFALAIYLYAYASSLYMTTYHYLPGRSESLNLLAQYPLFSLFFWGFEIILGCVIPIILLLTPKFRDKNSVLFLSVLLVVFGLVINRWNITVFGFLPNYLAPIQIPWNGSEVPNLVFYLASYRPTWVEWSVLLGTLSYAMLLYTLEISMLVKLISKRASNLNEKCS